MAFEIDMSPAVVGKSQLSIANIMKQIQEIHRLETRIFTYLDCLSQVLNLQGIKKGQCESELKAVLFKLANDYPAEMQVVIKQKRFLEDSKLAETLKKLDYLSAGIFGFYNRYTNFAARVFQQLKMTYAENKNLGAAYLTTGAGLLLSTGLENVFADDPNAAVSHSKILLGWGAAVVGGILMLTPLVNSFVRAIKKEL